MFTQEFKTINQKLDTIIDIIQKVETQMSTQSVTVTQLLAAENQENSDLALLATAVQTILSAVATNNITQAQAQQLLSGMTSGDTTVTGLASSITSALPPASPTSNVKS